MNWKMACQQFTAWWRIFDWLPIAKYRCGWERVRQKSDSRPVLLIQENMVTGVCRPSPRGQIRFRPTARQLRLFPNYWTLTMTRPHLHCFLRPRVHLNSAQQSLQSSATPVWEMCVQKGPVSAEQQQKIWIQHHRGTPNSRVQACAPEATIRGNNIQCLSQRGDIFNVCPFSFKKKSCNVKQLLTRPHSEDRSTGFGVPKSFQMRSLWKKRLC